MAVYVLRRRNFKDGYYKALLKFPVIEGQQCGAVVSWMPLDRAGGGSIPRCGGLSILTLPVWVHLTSFGVFIAEYYIHIIDK